MPRRTPLSSLRADDTWIDVTPLPDGSVAVASVGDTQIVVEQVAIDGAALLLWSRAIAPGQFGYLRAAADARGRVACIGQGQDGQAWLTRDGHPIESLGGETFGVFCVEVQGLLEGWEVAILRHGYYELLAVPLEGAPVVTLTTPTPTTQGFIQIDDGVVLQDDGRHAVPGLVLAERAGRYAAGQNPDAGPDRVRLTDDTGRFAALVEDSAQPPHVVEAHDGTLWVCSWLKSGAWFAGYQPSDIPWGNDSAPVPPEPPAKPPRVTIREFLPADGVAPLEVRAVAVIQAASGPVTTLQWLARLAGASEWTSIATNRAEDLDHTYTFDQAGRWELALRSFGPGGRDQTATSRIVTVSPAPVPPEPPMPEPGPDPSPRPEGDTVSLKCWDQTYVWCAEDGGGQEGDGKGQANATRTEVNVWETFRSIVAADGRVGFQAENGAWLCAEQNGELWFNRAKEPEFQPTAWEAFTVEPGLSGGTSLKTDHGTYVQAVGGGGSALIHAQRQPQHSEAAETFFPSRPLIPVVGPGASGEVYAGGLCQQGADCYADAHGPALPVLCHYGDGLSKYVRDPGHVRANLDLMRSHGYGGVRTWGSLGGSYWAGREVGPAHQGEAYWGHVTAFCEELKARGMGWFLSQGDCYPQSIGSDPRGFFRRLGQTVRPYAPQIALFEVANESRDTTPAWNAWDCAQMAAEFQAACPEVTIRLLSAFTGHEDVAITNDYSQNPATAFTVHGYRGGHWYDKVRHIFSFVYEQKPKRRLGWQGEPAGPGSRVSVTENKHELVDGPLMAMAAMSLMTRQGWVYFCGPGVISDEGETFAQMPGFACVPSVAAMLPKDVMQWTGGIFHGGDTWASQRMFKPEGETRCDHACSAAGAVVCLIYGPPPLRYTHVRGTIDVTHDLAGAAKLIIGHY